MGKLSGEWRGFPIKDLKLSDPPRQSSETSVQENMKVSTLHRRHVHRSHSSTAQMQIPARFCASARAEG